MTGRSQPNSEIHHSKHHSQDFESNIEERKGGEAMSEAGSGRLKGRDGGKAALF